MIKNIIKNKTKTNLLFKMAFCFVFIFIAMFLLTLKQESTFSVMAADKTQDKNKEKCYLSDIQYVEDKSSAASGHLIKLDKNDSDKMITLKVKDEEKVFLKGISAWASSEIVYDISNYDYDYFTSYVGVDISEQSTYYNTGVKFLIYTSKDNTNWDKKFETGTMYGWSNAESVKIDIKDAEYIKLVADKNSSSWWAEWYDEAIFADAKLIKESYNEEEDDNSTVDFVKTLDEYDEIIRKHSGEKIEGDYELVLLQRELVRSAGYDILQAYARYSDEYEETLKWLMSDLNNMRLYVLGGEPDGNYISSLQALTRLYQKHKDDLDIKETTAYGTVKGELYRKMMITISLTHSAQVALWMDTTSPENQSDAVTRYEIYKDLHEKGKFVVSENQDQTPWFESLKVEEMRYVMNTRLWKSRIS